VSISFLQSQVAIQFENKTPNTTQQERTQPTNSNTHAHSSIRAFENETRSTTHNKREHNPPTQIGMHIREQDMQHNTRQENTTHQLKHICTFRGFIYLLLFLIIYFNCKLIFARCQWHYNKTQHTNNTHHTKPKQQQNTSVSSPNNFNT
jgi:hypothetical protein